MFICYCLLTYMYVNLKSMTPYFLLCSIMVEGEGEMEKEREEKGVEGMPSRSAMMTNLSSVLLTPLAMTRTWWRLWRGTLYKPTQMSNGEGQESVRLMHVFIWCSFVMSTLVF